MAALSAGELDASDGPRITSSCYCFSKVCKPLDSDLANPALEGADLQGVIASGGERRCNSRKMSPLLRWGLAINEEVICSHSPTKGSFCMRRQPTTRFLLIR